MLNCKLKVSEKGGFVFSVPSLYWSELSKKARERKKWWWKKLQYTAGNYNSQQEKDVSSVFRLFNSESQMFSNHTSSLSLWLVETEFNEG